MSKPITKQERTKILRLHAQGLSRNKIAKQLHRSPSAVSRIVHTEGLTFDRQPPPEAVAAARADAAQLRAQLEIDLLQDAARMRAQLWQPAQLHSFGGKNHTHVSVEIPEPVFRDKRDLMQAVKNAIESATRLAAIDATAQAAAAVDQWLEHMTNTTG